MSYRTTYRTTHPFKGFLIAIGVVILLVALVLAVIYGTAWFYMLTVGIAHRDWTDKIPLLGYHGALALAWITSVFGVGVGVFAKGSSSRKSS